MEETDILKIYRLVKVINEELKHLVRTFRNVMSEMFKNKVFKTIWICTTKKNNKKNKKQKNNKTNEPLSRKKGSHLYSATIPSLVGTLMTRPFSICSRGRQFPFSLVTTFPSSTTILEFTHCRLSFDRPVVIKRKWKQKRLNRIPSRKKKTSLK